MNPPRDIIDRMKEIETEIQDSLTHAETSRTDAEKLQEYHSLLDQAQEFYNSQIAEIIARKRANTNTPYGGSTNGKSRVLIIEEILELHDKPMYINDILHWCERRGVQFNGPKNSPRDQLRSTLAGSKKFQLIGQNFWWLADVPIPSQEKRMETHEAIFDQ